MTFSFFFFFKQKTAYEFCARDWSSDVCSSDLQPHRLLRTLGRLTPAYGVRLLQQCQGAIERHVARRDLRHDGEIRIPKEDTPPTGLGRERAIERAASLHLRHE